MATIDPGISGRDHGKVWKVAGAILALLYACYKMIVDPSTGDAIFGFVIATILLVGELGVSSLRVGGIVRQYLVVPLRRFFGYGDRYARYLLIVIAVGGTALVVKKFFGLHLLPDSIDFVVKRLGPALTVVTVAVYLAMVISKLTFELSHVRYDETTVKQELCFYVCVSLFCIFFIAVNAGFGFWDNLVTDSNNRRETPLIWSPFMLKLLFCLSAVFLIWSISFGLNVLSRFFEWSLRDRVTAAQPE